jgi:type I restriction enzyme S subunit
MFWIQQNRPEFESRSAGSTFKEISKSNVKSIKLQLPPLPEQKRIVDLISSVDSYIDALQLQLESAKRSRNAVLHELLTAGGDDWKDVKLSDVTDLITDGSHFSPKTTEHGIPYVTVRDIKDGFLDLNNAARINEDSYLELEKNGCRPLPNDILFSKDGTVGKVALVLNAEKFVVLSSLAIIRSTNSVILPKFLALTMSSSEFQRNAIGSKTGLAIKRIVLKHLRDLRIKVPTISEQQRIIEIISEMDLVISSSLKTFAESANLRTGLLSDLLSGKHEIPLSYDKVIGAA